jgi:hypothetical protein
MLTKGVTGLIFSRHRKLCQNTIDLYQTVLLTILETVLMCCLANLQDDLFVYAETEWPHSKLKSFFDDS